MKTIKVRGLVIKEYSIAESDKRLVLLCKEHGKITVYARGARKPNSKFLAVSQLFSYADYVLAQGSNFYSLTQADLIENFYNIRNDLDKLYTAYLITEVCETTVLENNPCDDLLLLALKSLKRLTKNTPPDFVKAVFLFRFFLYYGIKPTLEYCAVCGIYITNPKYFCCDGVLCDNHISSNQYSLDESLNLALKQIYSSNKLELSNDIIKRLINIAMLIWDSNFEHGLII